MYGFGFRVFAHFIGLYPIKKCASGIFSIGHQISKGAGYPGCVPLLATGNAGVTTYADIEVDYQGELGHWFNLLMRPAK